MRLNRDVFLLTFLAICLALHVHAATFSMFPKAGRLLSPDGRFEVRDVAPESSAGELVGTSHSLWLTELDYVLDHLCTKRSHRERSDRAGSV